MLWQSFSATRAQGVAAQHRFFAAGGYCRPKPWSVKEGDLWCENTGTFNPKQVIGPCYIRGNIGQSTQKGYGLQDDNDLALRVPRAVRAQLQEPGGSERQPKSSWKECRL